MKFTSRLSVVALACLAGSAFAADPIKIGVDGPFTGGSSSMGVSMRDGVRMATDEINKAGGVLGRQIVLVERDDESKNERGVQIAQELINKEKVAAVPNLEFVKVRGHAGVPENERCDELAREAVQQQRAGRR